MTRTIRKCLNSWLIGGISLLLGNCSLMASEVEPDLPVGKVNNSDTLVYRANGLPVVANNYSNLGTLLASLLGGDSRAVRGQLQYNNSLEIRGIDNPSSDATGTKTHRLLLSLPQFQGVGKYQLQSPATNYQEYSVPYLASTVTEYATDPAALTQVTVTTWDTATRHLQGSFLLTVTAPGGAPNVAITEGSFDLVVDK